MIGLDDSEAFVPRPETVEEALRQKDQKPQMGDESDEQRGRSQMEDASSIEVAENDGE